MSNDFPIKDVSAETCARIYATHGSGSTLITDQGRSFTSAFFQEMCKILGVRDVSTSAYHAMSNGLVERLHRVLHDSIAYYIDSTGTNWDVLTFFLMAYRATPQYDGVQSILSTTRSRDGFTKRGRLKSQSFA
jgi:transposase InsO family protein